MLENTSLTVTSDNHFLGVFLLLFVMLCCHKSILLWTPELSEEISWFERSSGIHSDSVWSHTPLQYHCEPAAPTNPTTLLTNFCFHSFTCIMWKIKIHFIYHIWSTLISLSFKYDLNSFLTSTVDLHFYLNHYNQCCCCILTTYISIK